jgi:hypothetical protein
MWGVWNLRRANGGSWSLVCSLTEFIEKFEASRQELHLKVFNQLKSLKITFSLSTFLKINVFIIFPSLFFFRCKFSGTGESSANETFSIMDSSGAHFPTLYCFFTELLWLVLNVIHINFSPSAHCSCYPEKCSIHQTFSCSLSCIRFPSLANAKTFLHFNQSFSRCEARLLCW